MITFDHLKLARRDLAEMKRLRTFLLSGGEDRANGLIVHQDDGSCCRLEPWGQTEAAIHDALGVPPAEVNIWSPGAARHRAD